MSRFTLRIFSLVFSGTLLFFTFSGLSVFAQEHEHEGDEHFNYVGELATGESNTELQKRLEDNRREQDRIRALLDETRNKKVTLQNEIAYQDNQIHLTTLKIQETQAEIDSLTGQIQKLEGVLENLSDVFAERAVETYKLKRTGESIITLLTSDSVTEFVAKFQYLQRIQENDRELLLQMQSTQTDKEIEKSKVEVLHDKLESQNETLERQKTQKQNLLKVTQSDEKKYQEMLSSLKADESAIQKAINSLIAQIVAGIATGTPVSAGQAIGQQGNTGNVYPRPSSSCPECGSHLHFMVLPCDVTKGGTGCHVNPEPYLGQYSKPLDYKYISQGYGNTSFAQSGAAGYAFHSGLDMVAFHGAPIYAIDSGTVYYGTDSAGGKYALVRHKDDFWSAYWHLQ